MIHYQYKNATILFIGINPHFGSYDRGIPFSNNKLFWYLLNRAGLMHESMDDLRDDKSLKEIYENRFNKVYHLGLVNIIDRPTRDVTTLIKGEEEVGKLKISKIIRTHKPKIVCFIGKITYQKYIGSKEFTFGWQDPIDSSKIYVMHFPLRGKAEIRVDELKEISKNLI